MPLNKRAVLCEEGNADEWNFESFVACGQKSVPSGCEFRSRDALAGVHCYLMISSPTSFSLRTGCWRAQTTRQLPNRGLP